MASESLLNQLRQPFVKDNVYTERYEKYCSDDIGYIDIDGNRFSGYKTYSFYWQITYVKQPERSASGVIDNLNSYATFETPLLKINFSMMSIEDYRRFYNLIRARREFTVTCYDIVGGKLTTNKMYVTPDQYPKLYLMARKFQKDNAVKSTVELLGIQDYTIELIGTNADLDKVSVLYYYNESNDKTDKTKMQAEPDVFKGEEIIVGKSSTYPNNPPNNYKFKEWQDINGNVYNQGAITKVNDTLELYAMWEQSIFDTLSFNYGLSDIAVDNTTGKQITDRQVQQGYSIGVLPPITANPKVKDSDGNEYVAYENGGWYRLPVKDESVRVNSYDAYWSDRNTVIYCLYDKKKFSVAFYNTLDYIIPIQQIPYGEIVVAPILYKDGKTFKGWFYDDKFEKQFVQNSKMPPYNINLYAKWE